MSLLLASLSNWHSRRTEYLPSPDNLPYSSITSSLSDPLPSICSLRVSTRIHHALMSPQHPGLGSAQSRLLGSMCWWVGGGGAGFAACGITAQNPSTAPSILPASESATCCRLGLGQGKEKLGVKEHIGNRKCSHGVNSENKTLLEVPPESEAPDSMLSLP